MESHKELVEVFDFDGTLTSADTLLAFIRFVHGSYRFYTGFARFLPRLVLMKLGLTDNGRTKEKVFSHFFRGMTATDFDAYCDAFAQKRIALMRPKAVAHLCDVLSRGARLYVVSASVDRWVRPFLLFALRDCEDAASSVTVLGTEAEIRNGILTGRFATPNCYGAEKVCRLERVLSQPRAYYHITAYGDSSGDREMLAWADKGYYKPFRD